MKFTRVLDGRWLLEIGDHAHLVKDHELAALAEAVSFRLKIEDVVPTASGVGLKLTPAPGSDEDAEPKYLHLCFSDEAEDLAHKVMVASKIDHRTGRLKDLDETAQPPVVEAEPATAELIAVDPTDPLFGPIRLGRHALREDG